MGATLRGSRYLTYAVLCENSAEARFPCTSSGVSVNGTSGRQSDCLHGHSGASRRGLPGLDVRAAFLAREEIETKTANPEDRWTRESAFSALGAPACPQMETKETSGATK